MTTTVKALHVILAFAAIALLVVPGAMLEAIAHTRDVPFIRKAYTIGAFHGKIGGPIAILAALIGFAEAWRGGFPLTSGWLVATYVAFVAVIGIGIGYHARREVRIAALAQQSPDDSPSPDLAAAIDDPLARPMNWISTALWAFIVWLMVAKPF